MATSVDWERAWLKLKAHVRTKPSHGKRDLFDAMGDIEVDCMAADLLPVPQDEDLLEPEKPERHLRAAE